MGPSAAGAVASGSGGGEGPARRGPHTVLYLEHAADLGGACVSLRETLCALDRQRFRPVVAVASGSDRVRRFYEERGLEALAWPGIGTFEHTGAAWSSVGHPVTWSLLARGLAGWGRSERRTIDLVRMLGPDLVHLSSAVLMPSARALHREAFPFVWHVREMPVPGRPGVRTRALRRALQDWSGERLFLSEGARQAWVGGTRGTVVPEPVDLARFTPALDGAAARQRCGLPADAPVLLYAGGLSAIKGIVPLLQALPLVRCRFPRLVCLMPGARPDRGPLVALAVALASWATLTGRIERLLAEGGLDQACVRLPFTSGMPELIAASDVVLFPSTVDHFARPVAEAGAMGKPVVASRLPMIEEQLGGGEGALLVPPGDAEALAASVIELLGDPQRAREIGAAGRSVALRRFDAHRSVEAVMALYARMLPGTRGGVREAGPCG